MSLSHRAVLPLLLMALPGLMAQSPAPGKGAGIYSCVTPDGKRHTSDRPIAECVSREQRVLNTDGSLRTMLPPFLSPEARAANEARERQQASERAAQFDAMRRDRNLMTRFRNESAHQRARDAALDDINKAIATSERRIRDLAVERKPLTDEAEFYKNKALPGKLKQQLDANDAAVDAQRQLIENQKAERVRVNKLFDTELARLKLLWAGAAPGSLDAKPQARAASR